VEHLEDRRLLSFAAALASAPGAQLAADFNNDGKLDLAGMVWSDGASFVEVQLGNGDGSFQLPIRSPGSGAYLRTGDVNGDGRLDLAAFDANGVSVLLGNGDGAFAAPGTVFTAPPPSDPSFGITEIGDVAVGDLNADGKDDLLINWTDYDPYNWTYWHDVTVRLGNAEGSFTAPEPDTYSGVSGPLTVGDFNEDGHLDAVGWYGLLLGNGDGTLQALAADILSGHAADFDEDGHLDIVARGTDNRIRLYLGNGDGTFQPYRSIDWSSAITGSTGQTISGNLLAPANMDDDGHLDLVVAGSDLSSVVVLLGTGTGEFQTPQYFWQGRRIWHGITADFNADGRTDVALQNNHAPSTDVLLNLADWVLSPTLTIGDASVVEGDSGTTPAVFTVTLSAPVNHPVSVGYRTPGYAGNDYQGVSGTLSFAPGETTKTITVLVNGDTEPEPDQTFAVWLVDVVGGFVADPRGVGTIVNDDPFPSVTISDATVIEGHSGSCAQAVFTVTLSAPLSERYVYVGYETADGTATAGSDYEAASGLLTFAPGETSKTVTIQIIGDRLAEPNETFVVNLSILYDSTATIADGQGVGTITDDEPRVSISDVTKYEGKKGKTTLFTFTVTLSAAYDQAVTMSFATANGTATTGDGDYVAKTGTLTFAAGETTKTITIEVKGDSKKEADEVFYLDLFDLSSNALFTKNRGIGTILNDD
jgi:hypothetical protein